MQFFFVFDKLNDWDFGILDSCYLAELLWLSSKDLINLVKEFLLIAIILHHGYVNVGVREICF